MKREGAGINDGNYFCRGMARHAPTCWNLIHWHQGALQRAPTVERVDSLDPLAPRSLPPFSYPHDICHICIYIIVLNLK